MYVNDLFSETFFSFDNEAGGTEVAAQLASKAAAQIRKASGIGTKSIRNRYQFRRSLHAASRPSFS